jgi:hypothetical protein
MPSDNYKRLVELADEVFAVKNDPDQLDVNSEVLKYLKEMHPSTVSEYNQGNEPLSWLLVIPTSNELMIQFIQERINEKELYELTPLNASYDAIYLCSALVLEEHRRKGITKSLTVKAIEEIRKIHPVKSLFVWSFSKEGEIAAESIARETNLPLLKRSGKK